MLALVVAVALQCVPVDGGAHIFRHPNPKDIIPGVEVGRSWTLLVKREIKNDAGDYLGGDLVSPRGGTTNRNIYSPRIEWECGR